MRKPRNNCNVPNKVDKIPGLKFYLILAAVVAALADLLLLFRFQEFAWLPL